MLILNMFSWWYSVGFREQLAKIQMSYKKMNDQFSIPLLLKTLFQPFRQISAGKVDGALSDKIRAWFDRLISRLIGGVIRLSVMVIGLVAMLFLSLFCLIKIVFWLTMPILPFAGLVIIPWIEDLLWI